MALKVGVGMAITSVILLQDTIEFKLSASYQDLFITGTYLFKAFLGVNLFTNLILTGLIGKSIALY